MGLLLGLPAGAGSEALGGFGLALDPMAWDAEGLAVVQVVGAALGEGDAVVGLDVPLAAGSLMSALLACPAVTDEDLQRP